MTTRSRMLRRACLVLPCLATPVQAQVDYFDNGTPWRLRIDDILDRIHVLATVAMQRLSNNESDNR